MALVVQEIYIYIGARLAALDYRNMMLISDYPGLELSTYRQWP
jgi:hypothetical protein